MKLSNYNFIATANIKRGKKNNTVFYLMLFSVIGMLLIASFSATINNTIQTAKNEDRTRRFYITSASERDGYKPLTENVLNEIRDIPHVKAVDKLDGIEYQLCNVKEITDENGEEFLNGNVGEYSSLEFRSLFKSEKKDVVAGKTLEESPTYSCLVPSLFLTHKPKGVDAFDTRINFENGEDYIGKTIVVSAKGDELNKVIYNENTFITELVNLPSLSYRLKVVGVYDATRARLGGPFYILISNQTSIAIEQDTINCLPKDSKLSAKINYANSKPELSEYTLLVDKYDNIKSVFEQLEKMNILYDTQSTYNIGETTLLMGSIFSGAGAFLTLAIILLTILNIFLAVSNNMIERKGEIGLLKAVGYTNKNIFTAMYIEQLKICLKAFLIGLITSGVIVLIIDIINATGAYDYRCYVVPPLTFIMLTLVALAIAILVPLVCLLIMVGHITKSEPKDAMGA